MNRVLLYLTCVALCGHRCYSEFTINFDICKYLVDGGTCESECDFEARHTWGVPMCITQTVNTKCCIPASLAQKALAAKITTPSTTTATPATTTVAVDTFPPQCGQPRIHSRVRRVVGGSAAPPGAWPWQVAIRDYLGHYLCGGVILNQGWVLTAAHCIKSTNPRYLRVYVGDQTLSYDRSSRNKSVAIQRIIKHPEFQRNVLANTVDHGSGVVRYLRHYNDIALIKLERRLAYSDYIQPVCLPEAFNDIDEITDDCWVTGWGETDENMESSVQKLQEVTGNVMDHVTCGKRWDSKFENDVVCFGRGGSGPCKGDSGGGVTCRQPDGRYKLVGIVSWGRDDCIHDNHPSVLTKVASYQDWIHAAITEDASREPDKIESSNNLSDT